MKHSPQRFQKTAISLIVVLILYTASYYWLGTKSVWFFHDHILPNSTFFQLGNSLSALFSPKHWAILSLILGVVAVGCYLLKKPGLAKPLWYIFLSVVISLIIAAVIKYTLAKYRPEVLFKHHLYGFHFFSMEHAFNSTPSGHTTASFAALFALGKLSKRAWVMTILMLIALIVGISRLVVGAHFPSDILLGAYIGIISSIWIHHFLYKENQS